jgi:HEAT repeat protein
MDTAVTTALEEILFGERRPKAQALMKLSDLRPRQLEGFLETWLRAPVKRRRTVVSMLAELAEDNFELFFDQVFKLVLDDPDPEVRRLAAEGLWENDDIAIAERLLDLLNHDPDVGVRAQAAMTLGHFAYLAEMGELAPADGQRICRALLAAAKDSSAPLEVRRRAVEAVAYFSADPAVKELIVASYEAPEVKMRASALFAMGRNCDARWSPIVLRALESAESELRFEAARAAGELEDRRAVPRLLDLLDDEDTEVRLEAIAALGKIGGDQAKAALLRLTEHEDERTSEAAADALDEAMFAEDPLLRA